MPFVPNGRGGFDRAPLSPAEFRATLRVLLWHYPHALIRSTWRPADRNRAVGGLAGSKHLLSPLEPVACDLIFPGSDGQVPAVGSPEAVEIESVAQRLGLFGRYHDEGTGPHLHTQAWGLGPPPPEYEAAHGDVLREGLPK